MAKQKDKPADEAAKNPQEDEASAAVTDAASDQSPPEASDSGAEAASGDIPEDAAAVEPSSEVADTAASDSVEPPADAEPAPVEPAVEPAPDEPAPEAPADEPVEAPAAAPEADSAPDVPVEDASPDASVVVEEDEEDKIVAIGDVTVHTFPGEQEIRVGGPRAAVSVILGPGEFVKVSEVDPALVKAVKDGEEPRLKFVSAAEAKAIAAAIAANLPIEDPGITSVSASTPDGAPTGSEVDVDGFATVNPDGSAIFHSA